MCKKVDRFDLILYGTINLWIYLSGETMLGLVKSCIGTKFTSQFGDLIAVSIFCTYLFFSLLFLCVCVCVRVCVRV